MKFVFRYKATFISIVLAVIVIIAGLLRIFDFIAILHYLEEYEFDEFLLASGIILLGISFDLYASRLRHKSEIRSQKLRVLQATMRTVQDIVNNFLNSLQLIELDEENKLSDESKKLLQSMIRDTSQKINKIAGLKEIAESDMATGPGIDYKKE